MELKMAKMKMDEKFMENRFLPGRSTMRVMSRLEIETV